MSKDDARRRAENAAVLAKMKGGDNLCHTGLGAYRWAPRRLIPKDMAEVARVLGETPPKPAGRLQAVDGE